MSKKAILGLAALLTFSIPFFASKNEKDLTNNPNFSIRKNKVMKINNKFGEITNEGFYIYLTNRDVKHFFEEMGIEKYGEEKKWDYMVVTGFSYLAVVDLDKFFRPPVFIQQAKSGEFVYYLFESPELPKEMKERYEIQELSGDGIRAIFHEITKPIKIEIRGPEG